MCLMETSVAFLFNWIGFFLSFCLTTSAAGRYGAISGFGLSLIKWVLIVRVRGAKLTPPLRSAAAVLASPDRVSLPPPHPQFSTYFPGYFDGQYWLWWVFLALGT